MQTLLLVISLIAQMAFWLVLIQVIISVLASFDIINLRQPLVRQIYFGISKLLDPVLNPIRRLLPPAGGLDFSPMVLLLGLMIIQVVIANNI
jgi:YggT family protein